MKRFLFILLFGIIFSGCTKTQTSQTEVIEVNGENFINEIILYNYSGILSDVSGGNSTGVAQFGYVNNTYNLLATFDDLPDLEENFFYEGWVVRKESFSFISTGVIEFKDGVYSNIFVSDKDYSDFDFYVLTLEPTDDGEDGKPSPVPAEHILEGKMELMSQ